MLQNSYHDSSFIVFLSTDGMIVAIGDSDNDDNGDESGQVRVYQFDDTLAS